METKVQIIKDLQFHILNFNEYWEDPITESKLVTDTLDTVESIKSYCEMLKTYHKKNPDVVDDYEKYPEFIQNTISEIISLVSDGRDLWHKVKYENIGPDPFSHKSGGPREYDHHVKENGHLYFENDPFRSINRIIELCDKLIVIITSENKLAKDVDFAEITNSGLYYMFEGYENGSMSVRFDKIFIDTTGEILIDGRIIYFTSFDSHTVYYPGVVVMDVENYSISKLPYMDNSDFFDDDNEIDSKELYDCIKNHKTQTVKEVINDAKNAIENEILTEY